MDEAASAAATDALVDRVSAMRREAARQEAIDVEGSAEAAARASNAFCDAPPPALKGRGVRVASLNVWQPAADTWPRRRAAQAALLAAAAVDVVALQEVRGQGSSGETWAHELRAALAEAGHAMPHVKYVPGTGEHGIGGKPPDGIGG